MFKFSPYKIIFIWGLDFLDLVVTIVTPWIIGLAIDGLVMKEFTWFYIFIVIEIAMLLIGTINRYFDTRIYSKLIEKFSINYYASEIKKGTDISIIDARLQLIDDFSIFLENGLFSVISTFFSVIVSTIYIFKKTPHQVSLASIIVSIIVILITVNIKKKMMYINKKEKTLLEKEHNILRKQKAVKYAKYIHAVLEFGIKQSDLDSLLYLVATILQVFLIVFSVYFTVLNVNILPGSIFATMSYLINLNEDILDIPEHWWYIEDLKDSANRISD